MSRTLTAIAAAVSAAISVSDEQCVPLNLHTAVTDLAEFASGAAEAIGAADPQAVADLSAKVDKLRADLIAAGVIPEPKPADTPEGQ